MIDSKILAITFLETAKVDFDASRILYHNGLYAPAIFHLQQSIEKALKAVLLFVGIAENEEDINELLKKIAGHYVMKNLSKIAKYVMVTSNLRIKGIHKTLLPFLERSLEVQLAEYQNEIKKFEKLDV